MLSSPSVKGSKPGSAGFSTASGLPEQLKKPQLFLKGRVSPYSAEGESSALGNHQFLGEGDMQCEPSMLWVCSFRFSQYLHYPVVAVVARLP
jgi:hypothetical protein